MSSPFFSKSLPVNGQRFKPQTYQGNKLHARHADEPPLQLKSHFKSSFETGRGPPSQLQSHFKSSFEDRDRVPLQPAMDGRPCKRRAIASLEDRALIRVDQYSSLTKEDSTIRDEELHDLEVGVLDGSYGNQVIGQTLQRHGAEESSLKISPSEKKEDSVGRLAEKTLQPAQETDEQNGWPGYFIPGYGISREVISSQIQLFLGPLARARPYSYQEREGYLISGPCATITAVSPTLYS